MIFHIAHGILHSILYVWDVVWFLHVHSQSWMTVGTTCDAWSKLDFLMKLAKSKINKEINYSINKYAINCTKDIKIKVGIKSLNWFIKCDMDWYFLFNLLLYFLFCFVSIH